MGWEESGREADMPSRVERQPGLAKDTDINQKGRLGVRPPLNRLFPDRQNCADKSEDRGMVLIRLYYQPVDNDDTVTHGQALQL